jgi:hypothetical protein
MESKINFKVTQYTWHWGKDTVRWVFVDVMAMLLTFCLREEKATCTCLSLRSSNPVRVILARDGVNMHHFSVGVTPMYIFALTRGNCKNIRASSIVCLLSNSDPTYMINPYRETKLYLCPFTLWKLVSRILLYSLFFFHPPTPPLATLMPIRIGVVYFRLGSWVLSS